MPNNFTEGQITFSFDDMCHVTQYVKWNWYLRRFQNGCGLQNRAVDFLCIVPDTATLWLIEVKDFRLEDALDEAVQGKVKALPGAVAGKVRETLAGLLVAAVEARRSPLPLEMAAEVAFAAMAVQAVQLQVTLHFEEPTFPPALPWRKGRPKTVDASYLKQKLLSQLKAIDSNPLVVSISNQTSAPYTASDTPSSSSSP